jgi:rhodanese-related sulfurtransferase
MSSSNVPPAIDVDHAAACAYCVLDVVLLDVRENQEWTAGHAPTARHLPMSELAARVDELPRHARLVCICRSGNRSSQVTSWLQRQGYDAVNMTGGMQRWASHGHPVIDEAGHAGVVI